jgi:hypothetical protein
MYGIKGLPLSGRTKPLDGFCSQFGCDARKVNRMQVQEERASGHTLLKLSKSAWTLPIVISVGLVVPCFWQPMVSSVDLQSHLYNAWLTELIRSGSIHGLWIGHQSTNFLVDIMLFWLLKGLGISVAERVTTTALVLVFFWGAFRFISAVQSKSAYWLAPWLAVLSYGFVFQSGLLNYYLSCGIVLWLFAVVWGQRFHWRILWTAPLLVLAYFAHPLPVLWLLGLIAYCWLAQRVGLRFQILLLLGSVAAICLMRGYIMAKYQTYWGTRQIGYCTGADQAMLYGWVYAPVALGFLLFIIAILRQPENGRRAILSVPAQAYFLTASVIAVFPTAVRASTDHAWGSLIADRLSLLAGVLLLAMLRRPTYSRWCLPAGILTAAFFFGALYRDIGREAQVAAKMKALVETLPAGERVIAYAAPGGQEERALLSKGGLRRFVRGRLSSMYIGRLNSAHLISRACLGHCFDYMNYEPSTGQFRIHALPGNRVVLSNWADSAHMKDGTYVVKPSDLPLYGLFRCGSGPNALRLQPLPGGEAVAMLGCSGGPY